VVENLPATHDEHEEEPVVEKKPAVQDKQGDAAPDPAYVPAAQFVHAATPDADDVAEAQSEHDVYRLRPESRLNLPAAQGSHTVVPLAEKVPGEQFWQWEASLPPSVLESNLPISQAVHTLAPVAEYWPLAQLEHEELDGPACVPAAQSSQLVLPLSYFPAAQFVQEVVPSLAAIVPDAQLAHAVVPAFPTN